MYTVTCYSSRRVLATQKTHKRAEADHIVDRMKLNLAVDQICIRFDAFAVSKEIDSWVRGALPEPDKIWIVHSINTIDNGKQSTYNTMYLTEKSAIEAAKRCVESWNDNHPGAYVFKAVKRVQREKLPLVVTDL